MMPNDLTIARAAELIRRRELSAVELVDTVLERIDRLDPSLGAYIHVMRDEARAAARRADLEIRAGNHLGPLHGIPVGLKDSIAVAGIPTTSNSRLHRERIAAADATIVKRLRAAGAIIVGKHNLHEFAAGAITVDTPFPPTRNPWDRERVAGGSSSGSAAAVAAGLCLGAVGTDTGGSIRQPAALTGTVGLKPTYGLLSRQGMTRLCFSSDHCGILTWTVEDAALMLSPLAGHDAADPTSARSGAPADYSPGLRTDLKGLRIGVVRHFYTRDLPTAPEITSAVEAAVVRLEELGAIVEEVTLPPLLDFDACNRILVATEMYVAHANDLKDRWLAYGDRTRRTIMLGALVGADDYIRAQQLRTRLMETVKSVMEGYDALVCATINTVAARLSDALGGPGFAPPSQRMPFNVTGQPAMSVCCGFSKEGLPIGLQIAGRHFDEATLLAIGHAYERSTGWRKQRPGFEDMADLSGSTRSISVA